MPDFTAATFSGGTIALSSLRGRYVVLDFWATWCGPSIANPPSLGQFHDTVQADPRVAIVGLNLDDDHTQAEQFLDAPNYLGLRPTSGVGSPPTTTSSRAMRLASFRRTS